MFQNKKHVFFDLDHTLWDYDTSSDETLTELWEQYDLNDHGIPLNNFLNKFSEVNGQLWDRFHAGEIDKDVIRKERFPTVFSQLSVHDYSSATEVQNDYIQVCPTKPYLIDGVLELLASLTGKYELHIITNGFEEIQGTKLRSGGIGHYFDQIITSGMAGSQKPEPEIFAYSLAKAKATRHESVMIGDNPISDIHGAYLAGIDQVFYNPDGLDCPITPTLEISSMKDLIKYF